MVSEASNVSERGSMCSDGADGVFERGTGEKVNTTSPGSAITPRQAKTAPQPDGVLVQVNQAPFIQKLYSMLEDPELGEVITWSGNSDSFLVNPGEKFSQILCLYFKHTNISSFVRQLSMYGFHKVSSVSSQHKQRNRNSVFSWEFRHVHGLFRRNDLESLRGIRRRSARQIHGKQQRVHLVATRSASPHDTHLERVSPYSHLTSPSESVQAIASQGSQNQQSQVMQIGSPQLLPPSQNIQETLPSSVRQDRLPQPMTLQQAAFNMSFPPMIHSPPPMLSHSSQHQLHSHLHPEQNSQLHTQLKSRLHIQSHSILNSALPQAHMLLAQFPAPNSVQPPRSEDILGTLMETQQRIQNDLHLMQENLTRLNQSAHEMGILLSNVTSAITKSEGSATSPPNSSSSSSSTKGFDTGSVPTSDGVRSWSGLGSVGNSPPEQVKKEDISPSDRRLELRELLN